MWDENSNSYLFNKVAILGTGLMGGSLGMAIRERRMAREVWGFSRSSTSLRLAQEKGALDVATNQLEEAVGAADLVVLAVPVKFCETLVARSAESLTRGCLVTDVGSTKSYLEEKIPPLLPEGIYYIGGHPMTGSEESGVKAADPTLWENAIYVLTPSQKIPYYYRENLQSLVEGIGAQPLIMSPEEHDSIVSLVSHLPHLVAVALVKAAATRNQDELIRTLAAGGFRDTTRIAMGNTEMWKDICCTNRKAILECLQLFKGALEEIKIAVEKEQENNLETLLEEARDYRQGIPYRARSIFPEIFELVVLVKDTPGAIGKITTALGENQLNISEIEILHVREEEGGSIKLGFRNEKERIQSLELLKRLGYRVHKR